MVGTILPASVTVSAAQNYTFAGSGSLGGVMSLLKSGSGQLTLTTVNTYGHLVPHADEAIAKSLSALFEAAASSNVVALRPSSREKV